MDRNTFNAIMNTVGIENTDTDSVVNSIVQKYGILGLGMRHNDETDQYEYFYKAKVQELMDNGVTEEDLEKIRKNGWVLGDNDIIYKVI